MFLKFIKQLQQNSIFKFFSSVKTAIALLLLLATVIAVGTILESRYNAEYAKLIIYNTTWFNIIIFLIGLLILNATIARIPWRKRHLGFLITHLGMLIILFGSYLTSIKGIDGYLRVTEGTKNDRIVLDEHIFEFSSDNTFKKVLIPKSSNALSSYKLSQLNSSIKPYFQIIEHLPFVESKDPLLSLAPESGYFLNFSIKSAFFNQDVWLHSMARKTLQMGPATFRLIWAGDKLLQQKNSTPPNPQKRKNTEPQKDQLLVLDAKTNKILKTWDLKKNLSFKINDVKINVVNQLKNAIVSENKLIDNGTKPNPALELQASKGKESKREVLYGKFDNFSLHENGIFGLRFKFLTQVTDEEEFVAPTVSTPLGNTVDFIIQPDESLKLRLSKNNKVVLEQNIEINKDIVTPWMGMIINIKKSGLNLKTSEDVKVTQPQPKVDQLPPSAIKVSPHNKPEQAFWLTLGQSKNIMVNNNKFQVFYGRNLIRLPFNLYLDSFHKKNYPGTSKAVSFESHVKINGAEDLKVISMNEPLKKSGFTLYQSSYEQIPGQATASIFSVNQDPGRWLKYLGSIIMGLGIIIFTLSRTNYFKKRIK